MNGLTFFQKQISYSIVDESKWVPFKFSPNPIMIIRCEDLKVKYLNLSFMKNILHDTVESFHPTHELFTAQSNNSISDFCNTQQSSDFTSKLCVICDDIEAVPRWQISVWRVPASTLSSAHIVIEFKDCTAESIATEKLIAVNQKLLIASVDQHEIASVVKTLNKKLNEANLVKNQFIAVMNHEIRTPLNAIIGFSDLMLGKPSETDQLEYSGRIKRNGKILLHLIEDLLDLSKIEADCLEVESHSFDLRQIFDDVHSMLSPLAVAKGITLEWDVDSSLPVSVITDSTRFKQILTNIIGNALKFSTLGFVKVFVTATEDRNDFKILVSDSGGGIAEENREKIFQPFSQADSTITRRFGGTGLGLHLSRRIARAMGGEIKLLKSEINVGSTFAIFLPLRKTYNNRPPQIDSSANSKSEALTGLRVLLVEDAPDNQVLMYHVLRNTGCELKVVSNGAEAVVAVEENDFDVILMDIGMPVMDGITATRIIRNLGYRGSIIALSAHAMKNEVEECLQSGFDAHVSKPVNFERLTKTILETSKRLKNSMRPLLRSDLPERPKLH